ncbi:F0F1 ATP synthase subunit B [Arenibacter latericius]|uniref:F0F1 ATP synthase subunit B n=1 Tax=Arenibacter latericius TaxID=86104 RepID=UPI0003FCF5D2|nr:F0F1 ATP synthase subunit B [Arenibacter latericius]MDX1364412.1 F0F1 ATP synthase subunit B [Arenibacter latericius]
MEKLIEQFSFGLFFWQLLLLIILLVVLRKVAWKPILNAIDERESGIKNALEAAENAKKEMQNVTADSERLLQEARMERDSMIKEAREMKEKIVADAKELAQVEADNMISQAKTAIEGEKKAAVADIKNQVATLSLEIAEKVIKEKFSEEGKQLKLVEEMVSDIKLN